MNIARPQTTSKAAILQKYRLFASLPTEVVERLASYCRLQSVAKGETLFQSGDPGRSLIIVVTGLVNVLALSSEGKEIILNVIGAGEPVGEIALLDGRPRTATCVAMEDSEILVLERRDFVPVLEQSNVLARHLIEVLCDRLRRTSLQVESLAFHEPDVRLARAIVDLMEKTHGGHGEARIDITQQQLGSMVGLTRESTNRVLRRWEKDGLITLKKGALLVHNETALNDLSLGEGAED